MAWTTVANLKGDIGPAGPAGGTGIQGSVGPAGPTGADGTSVTISGSVANAAALPTGLGSTDKGKGYITVDDGHLHVWSGTAFTDVGTVRGPTGPAGATGPAGGVGATGPAGGVGAAGSVGATGQRGNTWFTGAGTPTAVAGSIVGDLYLDTTTGFVYTLS